MPIQIHIQGENAREALTELAGLARGLMGQLPPRQTEPAPSTEAAATAVAEAEPETPSEPAEPTPEPEAPETPSGDFDARKVHEPREGKTRRSSEEKASDERIMALSAKKGVPLQDVNAMILKVGRERVEHELDAMEPLAKQSGEKDQISTGEPRVNPEDEAQDAEDEKAEADAKRDPQTPLTQDDLKAAMTGYVTKFGADVAQADGKQIFEDALGPPPENAKGWRMSLVADQGQEALAKAITAWDDAAAADGRYGAGKEESIFDG